MILHPCPYCGLRSQLPEIGRCEDPGCMKQQRAKEKMDKARHDPDGTMVKSGVPPRWLLPIPPGGYLASHNDQLVVTNDWRHGGLCLATVVRAHIAETGSDSLMWIEGLELAHCMPVDVPHLIERMVAAPVLAVNSLRLIEDAGLIAGLARRRQPHGFATFISAMTTESDMSEFGVRRMLENVGLRDLYHVVVSYPEEPTEGEACK